MLRDTKVSSRLRAELKVPVLLPVGAHLCMSSLLFNGYQADLPILTGASDSSSSPTLQQGKLLVCVDIFKVFIIQIQQLELYP